MQKCLVIKKPDKLLTISSQLLNHIFISYLSTDRITKIIWIIKTIVECTVDRQRLL